MVAARPIERGISRPDASIGSELSKDPSKIKRCSECNHLVDAATMRPLSRNQNGDGIRHVCPDCYARIMAFRKAVRTL